MRGRQWGESKGKQQVSSMGSWWGEMTGYRKARKCIAAEKTLGKYEEKGGEGCFLGGGGKYAVGGRKGGNSAHEERRMQQSE